MSSAVALEFENWEPASVRYMQPRVNDQVVENPFLLSAHN